MRCLLFLALVPLLGCRIEQAASGRPPGEPTAVDSLAQIEQDSTLIAGVQSALRLHYQRYAARDWPAFRRTFWPGATIGMRGTPPSERRERVWLRSVDEFAHRQGEGQGRASGIGERVVHMHVTGYGDVADAWVIAERKTAVRRDSVRMVRGIDAFHLVRDGAEWRIVSLTSTPEDPVHRLVLPARRPARRAATARSAATKSAP
jgi:hypothetical protein